jgi:ketosteroid isomerase-like protein
MSQENLEIVEEVAGVGRSGPPRIEAIERGDMAMFDGMTTEDLVLVQPPEVPDTKTYEGRGAIVDALEDWPNQWEDFRMDLIEIIDAGDEVAVSVTRHRGRGRESGIEMDFEVFYVQRGRDGKLARMEMFFSREQALEAAGLSE